MCTAVVRVSRALSACLSGISDEMRHDVPLNSGKPALWQLVNGVFGKATRTGGGQIHKRCIEANSIMHSRLTRRSPKVLLKQAYFLAGDGTLAKQCYEGFANVGTGSRRCSGIGQHRNVAGLVRNEGRNLGNGRECSSS